MATSDDKEKAERLKYRKSVLGPTIVKAHDALSTMSKGERADLIEELKLDPSIFDVKKAPKKEKDALTIWDFIWFSLCLLFGIRVVIVLMR
jgi:hypothetical protein